MCAFSAKFHFYLFCEKMENFRKKMRKNAHILRKIKCENFWWGNAKIINYDIMTPLTQSREFFAQLQHLWFSRKFSFGEIIFREKYFRNFRIVFAFFRWVHFREISRKDIEMQTKIFAFFAFARQSFCSLETLVTIYFCSILSCPRYTLT